MNKATLIRKEVLPNNFKLIFKNLESTQFLILHKSKKEIYNQLELNQEYFYTWKKGKKNYCFINPYSIKKDIKKTEQPIKHQKQTTTPQLPQQGFFIQQLIKDLKLKDLNEEEFFNKMECLKNEFKITELKDNLEFAFKWIKEFLTTLYLKHNKLEKEITEYNYTKQEQEEQEFLAEIGAMFLNDWIHYQEKRENKYKSKLTLGLSKNKTE